MRRSQNDKLALGLARNILDLFVYKIAELTLSNGQRKFGLCGEIECDKMIQANEC